MGEINEYYGVASTATSDYLAHYGVLGMKWGVRRAVNSGNSQKLGKQYAKAQKKLAKLEKQAANSKKYAKRAAALGAGAAVAGGLAAAGTTGVSKGIAKVGSAGMAASRSIGRGLTLVPGRNKVSQALHNAGVGMYKAGQRGSDMHKGIANVSKAVGDWGNSNSIGQAVKVGGRKFQNANGALVAKATGGKGIVNATDKLGGVSNNTIARIGAGAIGAGLAAGAARNAYKAATAKKKAEKFRAEMNKAFAGTQYGRKSSGASKSKKRRG